MKKIVLFIIILIGFCFSCEEIRARKCSEKIKKQKYEKIKLLYAGEERENIMVLCIEGIKYIYVVAGFQDGGVSITPMINDKGEPCKCK